MKKLPFKLFSCHTTGCEEQATHRAGGSITPIFCDEHYRVYERMFNHKRIRHGILKK